MVKAIRWAVCIIAVSSQNNVRLWFCDLEKIASFRLGLTNGPGGKLDNRMSRQTRRDSPRGDAALHLLDAMFSVKIDEVNWKLHEEGVNRFTRNDPQAGPGFKFLPVTYESKFED